MCVCQVAVLGTQDGWKANLARARVRDRISDALVQHKTSVISLKCVLPAPDSATFGGAPGGRALHLLLTLTRTNFCIVSLWDNPIQSKGAVALAKVLAHDSQSSLTVLL